MRSRASLLFLLLALGCSNDHLPVLETEHLRFHGELEGTCKALGTLQSAILTAEACRWKVMAVAPEDCDEATGFRYSVTPL